MEYQIIEDLYEELFVYAVDHRFTDSYKIAESVFISEKPSSDILGFAEWFIFNFNIVGHNRTVSELFYNENKDPIRAAIDDSRRSVFKIHPEHDHLYLKDIFTGETVKLGHSFTTDSGLLNVRVVIIDDAAYIIGDIFEIDGQFEEAIKKTIYDAYNKFCIENAVLKIEDFIKRESRLFYSISTIIQETIEENMIDDDFSVFEGLFAYKLSYDALIEAFLKLPYELHADEDDEMIYRLMTEQEILCEIEITPQTFTLLCVKDEILNDLIEKINDLNCEKIVFVERHMLTLDELI